MYKHNLSKANINNFTYLQEYHSIDVATNIGAEAIFLMSLIYIVYLNVLGWNSSGFIKA